MEDDYDAYYDVIAGFAPSESTSVLSSSSKMSTSFLPLDSQDTLNAINEIQPITGTSLTEESNKQKPGQRRLQTLTVGLVDYYAKLNDLQQGRSERKPVALTIPSTPLQNEAYDNRDFDYILRENEIIGSEEGHQYQILGLLGHGTFGQVAKCQHLVSGQIVAVKVIKNKPAYFNQSMSEVKFLELLNLRFDPDDRHHILRLTETLIFRHHLCLVFELLSINLYELIKQNNFRGVSTTLVRLFTRQILDCLTILNQAKIIHCDLKPENILLKSPGLPTIKVIDFGSACSEQQTVYSYIQSRFYRAPEVLLGMPYSAAIDIWSLGCICAELFLGLPLFPGSSEYNQLSRIVEMLGVPPAHLIELGKYGRKYFVKRKDHAGNSVFVMKSITEYSREYNLDEKPSKRYFEALTLPELIKTYPMRKQDAGEAEIQKEMQARQSFLDFLSGLLRLNPTERWVPSQALQHPFVTGEPYTGPFEPTSIDSRSRAFSSPMARGQPQFTPPQNVLDQNTQASQSKATTPLHLSPAQISHGFVPDKQAVDTSVTTDILTPAEAIAPKTAVSIARKHSLSGQSKTPPLSITPLSLQSHATAEAAPSSAVAVAAPTRGTSNAAETSVLAFGSILGRSPSQPQTLPQQQQQQQQQQQTQHQPTSQQQQHQVHGNASNSWSQHHLSNPKLSASSTSSSSSSTAPLYTSNLSAAVSATRPSGSSSNTTASHLNLASKAYPHSSYMSSVPTSRDSASFSFRARPPHTGVASTSSGPRIFGTSTQSISVMHQPNFNVNASTHMPQSDADSIAAGATDFQDTVIEQLSPPPSHHVSPPLSTAVHAASTNAHAATYGLMTPRSTFNGPSLMSMSALSAAVPAVSTSGQTPRFSGLGFEGMWMGLTKTGTSAPVGGKSAGSFGALITAPPLLGASSLLQRSDLPFGPSSAPSTNASSMAATVHNRPNLAQFTTHIPDSKPSAAVAAAAITNATNRPLNAWTTRPASFVVAADTSSSSSNSNASTNNGEYMPWRASTGPLPIFGRPQQPPSPPSAVWDPFYNNSDEESPSGSPQTASFLTQTTFSGAGASRLLSPPSPPFTWTVPISNVSNDGRPLTWSLNPSHMSMANSSTTTTATVNTGPKPPPPPLDGAAGQTLWFG